MWILLLLLLTVAGVLSALFVICACVLSGRIDCEQASIAQGGVRCDPEDVPDAPSSGAAPVSQPQLLFN